MGKLIPAEATLMHKYQIEFLQNCINLTLTFDSRSLSISLLVKGGSAVIKVKYLSRPHEIQLLKKLSSGIR